MNTESIDNIIVLEDNVKGIIKPKIRSIIFNYPGIKDIANTDTLEDIEKDVLIWKILKKLNYGIPTKFIQLDDDKAIEIRRIYCKLWKHPNKENWIGYLKKIIHINKDYTINIDDISGGHIIGTVQNLILNYGKIDEDFGTSEGQKIATCASMTNLTSNTQSSLWCPLIWGALVKANAVTIPRDWYKMPNEKLEECVNMLLNLDGWSEYAVEILSTPFKYDQLKDNNNFDNPFIRDETKRISNIIKLRSEAGNQSGGYLDKDLTHNYYKKYLDYKLKYIYLKALLNKK